MKILLSLLPTILASLGLVAQNYSDSLTIALNKHYQSSDLPGFSVSIVSENGVHYTKGFGYANKETQTSFTPQTAQYLGSVSKTVVGLALVKAIEEGKLTWDTSDFGTI